MTLFEILLGAGLVAGVVLSSLAYLDSVRRGMARTTRLARALVGGGLGLAGFLAPHVLSNQLRYVYFQVLKPRPIAVSPVEWRTVSLATGLLLTIVLGGLYVAGSRYQRQTRPNQQ